MGAVITILVRKAIGSAASAQLNLCFQPPPPEPCLQVSKYIGSPVNLNSIYMDRINAISINGHSASLVALDT